MCGRMNLSMAEKIRREAEQVDILKKRLADALAKDQSHTKRLSEN